MFIGNCELGGLFCMGFWEGRRDCGLIWGGVIRYYDGGVSSVYFWDLDDGFAGAVLLKKSTCVPWSPNDY